jgi:probable HAF family extracellular repeat protein
MTRSLLRASAPPLAPLALLALTACTDSPVGPTLEASAEKPEPVRASVVSVTDLGALPEDHSSASGINDRAQVVGSSLAATGDHAVLWENGTITDLGTLSGVASHALGINNRGQVVGIVQFGDGKEHGFLWEDGTVTDLGTLAGIESQAFDINSRGQVVGGSTTTTGDVHAALWENGTITRSRRKCGPCRRSPGRTPA